MLPGWEGLENYVEITLDPPPENMLSIPLWWCNAILIKPTRKAASPAKVGAEVGLAVAISS
ncbi:hypothetical protein Pan97_04270 [Bremerella volcania]|uniref:Uncharacterized protein n=1 Tax=Bremerella volcania TaxID=2527984 RepID=A0A518C2J7_9BACT|nr:hypothetical protein Pan97_04270 [Bremerella volcania]